MLNKLKPTIAVIDSGIGGVCTLKRLIDRYKFGNFIYFADNLFMPYGKKTARFIKSRVESIIEMLNQKYQPDYILIACNTASSVIDVEKFTNIRTISFSKQDTIFATSLTAKQLDGYNVIADTSLASMIEKYIEDKQKLEQIVKIHVKRFDLAKYRQITLGCTHYELVEHIFKKLCPKTTFICNSLCLTEAIDFEPMQNIKTVKVLLSKNDEKYEQFIYNLINTKGDKF